MAILRIPDKNQMLNKEPDVQRFLDERGIFYEHWTTDVGLAAHANDDQLLAAYDFKLKPLMEKGGYKTADVINVDSQTPNLQAIRDKFNREHYHSENEVRFFVEGQGLFWFHKDDTSDEVFSVLCQKGDLISVPANIKHWFDLGDTPKVRAIRVFTDPAGQVPNYTGTGIEQRYC